MKIKLYCNYGVLAHEKTWVYTYGEPHHQSDAYSTVIVSIPDDLQPYETNMGDVVVTLDGAKYLLSEALSSRNDKPCIRWYDGTHTRYAALPVIEHREDTRRTDTRYI